LRRQLRERALLVRMRVMLKNKIAGLLTQSGISYETPRLPRKGYFPELLATDENISADLKQLLILNRQQIDRLGALEKSLVEQLKQDPLLAGRLEQLCTIQGMGEITALTGALETGEPSRFPNARHAISYCGLCAAQRESAGSVKRGPLSKQRHRFLQTMLIETAHLAVHFHPALRALYERMCGVGPKNRATLEVARRLVRSLLAVDRQDFARLSGAVCRHGRSIR
jgi:transposase